MDTGYYKFLNRNTNISRAVRVNPAEVRLTSSISAAAAGSALPNIFILVVDSMRRDYLAPYNDKVTFTPAIDRFAKESAVMRNAFSRYGGTGLSEPSIWSGSMLVHKQYVTPFHPMNSLEKLLDTFGYTKYISVDTILRAILKPGATTVELDRGIQNMNYDFGVSLKDLAGKLDQTKGQGPVFAYTQPQNLHISVINRASRSVPAGEAYPGFDAPYASRMKRVDQAFGEFIAFLKSRGLYENSIVVLTADHGDSLGEDGRWGHAYSLYPEVLRIPLLIHLPERLRAGVWADTRSVAFSTDITPSLYYLLGQRPIQKNELYGRPLFTATPAEQNQYRREDVLVASSYAPVYGILHRGRELY
ncbi:MAG: sulfatase-like hydrolase/transferase, partial [Acidobacteria bacterium]|nr:sulfatase-like hydrolase/transferase [Acidobacteriota bacterium]